jgi:hypothetical protein
MALILKRLVLVLKHKRSNPLLLQQFVLLYPYLPTLCHHSFSSICSISFIHHCMYTYFVMYILYYPMSWYMDMCTNKLNQSNPYSNQSICVMYRSIPSPFHFPSIILTPCQNISYSLLYYIHSDVFDNAR